MHKPSFRPIVLCLSGHDPIGGAGLQADIEALIAQGCHAAPAVTALTIQDTANVSDFRILDHDWIIAQARAILADVPVRAIKLGMLGSGEMVRTACEVISMTPESAVVCDPVLRAEGGGSLGEDDVGYVLRNELLPKAIIATPNLPEAQIMAELPQGTADECAAVLLKYCPNILITGGHGTEHELHNRLYLKDGSSHDIIQQRLPGKYHGSGCTLASALAGRLALGEELVSAVRSALDYTWRCLRDAEAPGKGQFIPRRLPLD